MKYIGMPFNTYSEIDSNELVESYFIKASNVKNIGEYIYEKYSNGNITLVVYQNVEWNNEELMSYHTEEYFDIPYYTENKIRFNVYEITKVENFQVLGWDIFKYDDLGRVLIEQIFDDEYLLLEYRQYLYKGEERIPCKEKVFLKSWHISENS